MQSEFEEIGKPKYKLFKSNDIELYKLSEKVLNGELVIFPTETVYGLGANALDTNAVDNIFKVKNRPTNNPIIVHCMGKYDALMMANIDKYHTTWFSRLADKFWPGPLTIIVRAGDIVPKNVRANGDYVGLRAPNNAAIQKLIRYTGFPIAAPSANISGKTSSTCLDHIFKYFNDVKINIIDDENYISKHGIESTIILFDNKTIKIMRPGFITRTDIEKCINEAYNASTEFSKPTIIDFENNVATNDIEEQKDQVSPGQFRAHYCPEKPLYILNVVNFNAVMQFEDHIQELKEKTAKYLYRTALIDFNGFARKYRDKFMAYVDLSEGGDFKEAMFNLYNVFHEIDKLECDKIMIYDFSYLKNDLNIALWDRINRASVGKKIAIPSVIF